MKNIKYLFIMIIAFSLCVFFACNSDSQNNSFVEITGIKEISIKIGEGTDEKLLEGIDVVLPDGSKVKPDLIKDGYNSQIAGKYKITYSYGNVKKDTNVYVYGMPKLFFGDTEIVSDKIEITFGQAMSSYDFVRGIRAFDCFGKAISVEKSLNSDEFTKTLGEYHVQYNVTDIVGNTLVQNVTFVVTEGDSPIAEGGTYSFDVDGCRIPCNLKGEKDGLLFDNEELVNPVFYMFDKDNLILSPEYCLVNTGEHDYKIETIEGVVNFKVSIVDEGYPVFELEKVNNATYIFGGAYASTPTDKRPKQDGYVYSYSLKNSLGETCSVIKEEDKIIFYTIDGECLPTGNYFLSVTAEATNHKISQKDYSFIVKYPSLSGGEKSQITEINEKIDGVETDYLFEKADGSHAWDGRIYIKTPAKAYKLITFNIYYDYCESQEGNRVNAKLQAVIEQDYNRIIKCIDKKTGALVSIGDMIVGRWYNITINAMSSENGNVYLYFVPFDDNNIGVKAYIADFEVHLNGSLNDMPIFKSIINKAVIAEYQYDGTLITMVNYNAGGSVHTTPFSDSVWEKYLAAQEEGGKVMRFDVKFAGSATYNGYINNAQTYMSTTIRGNRTYVRFYDAEGTEIAYTNLSVDTWYKMVFDIDAIKAQFGEMSTVSIAGHTGSSLRFSANIEGETIYVKNIEFVEKPAEAQPDFKSSVADAVNAYFDEQGENVTEVHYNGGSVHTTPFSDSVWEKYLAAQEEGGKVMRFDVKFAGSATYNGYINNAQTYMSTTIRGNRTYVRFYDAEGTEIAYTNLSVDTWYKMVFDIDAIKAQFGEMSTVSIAGHTGSSLRFSANIEGETIYVKNIDFVEKSAEIPSKPDEPDEPINPIGENDFDNVITDNFDF